MSDEENGVQIPTQAQSVVEGSSTVVVSEYKPIPDIDYLQVSFSSLNFNIMAYPAYRIFLSDVLSATLDLAIQLLINHWMLHFNLYSDKGCGELPWKGHKPINQL